MEPMLSPMIALWTSSEAVMPVSKYGRTGLAYCIVGGGSERKQSPMQ